MENYNDYRPSLRDSLHWSATKIFNEKLINDGVDVLVDGVPTKAIVQLHTNPLNELKEDRKILCPLEIDIKRGSIVDYDNDKWLTLTNADSNQIYKFAKIHKCNNFIPLYKNNTLYNVPCIIGSSVRLYQLGSNSSKYIETPSSTIVVKVSNSGSNKEITQLIERNDVYKIGMQSWRVTDINDISEPGILIVKLDWHVEVTSTETEVKEVIAPNIDETKKIF